MTGGYRIVHFVPDPFSGTRVPIGALVAVGGSLEVVRAHSAASTQTGPRAVLIDFIASKLSSSKDLSTLPPSTGPQAVLGPLGEIPSAVADPVGWVRKFILPHEAAATSRKKTKLALARAGMELFKQFSVAQYVRNDFTPARAWSSLSGSVANDLQKVTHWAGASDAELVLMEPIAPDRPNAEQVQSRIFARFSAYSHVLKSSGLKAQLVVYLLQGGDQRHRTSIRRGLEILRDVESVDTEVEGDRRQLFTAITQAAASGASQLSTSTA